MHYVRFVSTDRITIAVLLIYTASIIILPGAAVAVAATDGGDSSDHLRYAVPKHNYTHLIILDNACN